MKLNANNLTLWELHSELSRVVYSLLEMSSSSRAVEITAGSEKVIFKAFHRWRDKVHEVTVVDNMVLNPLDSFANITCTPLLILLTITSKPGLEEQCYPKPWM